MSFIVDTFSPGDTITVKIAVRKSTFAPLNPTEISSVTMTLLRPDGTPRLTNVVMLITDAQGNPLPAQTFQYVFGSDANDQQSTTAPWTATFIAIGELGTKKTYPIPLFWLSAFGTVQ